MFLDALALIIRQARGQWERWGGFSALQKKPNMSPQTCDNGTCQQRLAAEDDSRVHSALNVHVIKCYSFGSRIFSLPSLQLWGLWKRHNSRYCSWHAAIRKDCQFFFFSSPLFHGELRTEQQGWRPSASCQPEDDGKCVFDHLRGVSGTKGAFVCIYTFSHQHNWMGWLSASPDKKKQKNNNHKNNKTFVIWSDLLRHVWRTLWFGFSKVLLGKSCNSAAILAKPRKAQRDQTLSKWMEAWSNPPFNVIAGRKKTYKFARQWNKIHIKPKKRRHYRRNGV